MYLFILDYIFIFNILNIHRYFLNMETLVLWVWFSLVFLYLILHLMVKKKLIHQGNKAQPCSRKVSFLLQAFELDGILHHFNTIPVAGTTALTDAMMTVDWILHLSPSFCLTVQANFHGQSNNLLLHPSTSFAILFLLYPTWYFPLWSHFQLNSGLLVVTSFHVQGHQLKWLIIVNPKSCCLLVSLTTRDHVQCRILLNKWMNEYTNDTHKD